MVSSEAPANPATVETKEASNVPIELSNMPAPDSEAAASSTTPGTKAPMGAPNGSSSAPPINTANTLTVSSTPPSLPPIQSHDSSFPSVEESRAGPPPLIREATAPAIGPATDKPITIAKDGEDEGPVLYITLLLTTGARHPFKLDRKYLKKRSVEVEDDNPVNMSLYKLKELILRDWRDEWEAKPASPDSIRLISMGKLLTDKSKLSDFGFKDGAAPTIVHMTIKPQDILDEEDANKTVRDRESSVRSPRCRCLIM